MLLFCASYNFSPLFGKDKHKFTSRKVVHSKILSSCNQQDNRFNKASFSIVFNRMIQKVSDIRKIFEPAWSDLHGRRET
jgi:hypothetical protein